MNFCDPKFLCHCQCWKKKDSCSCSRRLPFYSFSLCLSYKETSSFLCQSSIDLTNHDILLSLSIHSQSFFPSWAWSFHLISRNMDLWLGFPFINENHMYFLTPPYSHFLKVILLLTPRSFVLSSKREHTGVSKEEMLSGKILIKYRGENIKESQKHEQRRKLRSTFPH